MKSEQRFTRRNPCPVCDGYPELPQHRGTRCWGFLSSDGEWAHCTREEYADGLDFNDLSNTYAHRLDGDCACGVTHRTGEPVEPREVQPQPDMRWMNRPHIKDTYDYHDADGKLVYRRARYETGEGEQRLKWFLPWRPDPEHPGQSIPNLEGIRPVLYRLPELRDALAQAATLGLTRWVFEVEGEKAVDYLWEKGLLATTAGGANDWRPEFAEEFRGHQVVIVADNDEKGRRRTQRVARDCHGIAARVTVLDLPGLPPSGGLDDWFEQDPDQHMQDMLRGIIRAVPDWEPSPEAESPSWLPVDLEALLAGDLGALEPTRLRRGDGVLLLYPGRVHDFHCEPETLKSWAAQVAVAEVLMAGGRALYLDFEAEARDVVGHLLALGVSQEQILEGLLYIRPEEGLGKEARPRLLALLAANPIEIAVLDGENTALAASGYEPNSNADVLTWKEELVRPVQVATSGPTILIDHVTKNPDTQGRWAVGAGQKLALIDGASFSFKLIVPFGVGRTGLASIHLSKDRPGHLRGLTPGMNPEIAQLRLESHPDGSIDWELRPSAGVKTDEEGKEVFRPTVLMERVSRFLEEAAEPQSKAAVEKEVPGKRNFVRDALAALVVDGYVEVMPGPHNSLLHHSLKPYRQEDSATPQEPSIPCPACGQLAYTAGPNGLPERRCLHCQQVWTPTETEDVGPREPGLPGVAE